MKKIITSLFIFVFSFMFINNVNAITITESTDSTDGLTTIQDNSIVIGVTRFEDGVVITAQRAATAGVNDALFNIGVDGYSGVSIYYFLGGDWFVLDDDNEAKPLDENEDRETLEKLENPDIYYVNNEEKKLNVDFSFNNEGELEFNTNNNKEGLVKYENGKLIVPATVKTLEIKIKDPDTGEVIGLVVLTKDSANNTDYETTSLTNYINALGRVVAADYTEASWATYQSVVLANVVTKNNTQGEVDTATSNITTAQGSLVFAGKAALDAAKGVAGGKTESAYTIASWEGLTTALGLPETTNALILTKTTAINNAINALVTKLAQAKEAALDIKSEAELRASLAYEGVTELKLNQDINLVNRLDITGGKVITLDLNGKTISSTLGTTFYLTNGTLSVIDTASVNGGIVVSGEAFRVNGQTNTSANEAVLNIESGVNVTSSGDCAVFIYGTSTLNTAGNLTSNWKYAPIQGNGEDANNGTVINITGGSITSTFTDDKGGYHAIYVPQNGEMNISGGTITSAGTAIEAKGGTLTISGGTISTSATSTSHVPNNNGGSTRGYALAVVNNSGYSGAQVTVSGGTINGPIEILDDDGEPTNNNSTLEITGGEFSDIINAVKYSASTSTIKLNQDVNLKDRLDITEGKVITLDLNGKTLSRDNQTIRVQNGTLNLIGIGTIKENNNDGFAPILIKGSTVSTDTNYSNVTVGKDVILRGFAGLFIDQNAKKAYGVNVEFNGKIVSPAEEGHTAVGYAIYVNGSIKHAENAPVIRIGSTAIIESPRSHGIYAAGYANWTIEDGASITGVSAIEIKAGTMAINGGTFTATEVTPSHVAFGNGTSTKGYALAVVNNAGYGNTLENPLTVNINGGEFNVEPKILDDDTITTNNYAVLKDLRSQSN